MFRIVWLCCICFRNVVNEIFVRFLFCVRFATDWRFNIYNSLALFCYFFFLNQQLPLFPIRLKTKASNWVWRLDSSVDSCTKNVSIHFIGMRYFCIENASHRYLDVYHLVKSLAEQWVNFCQVTVIVIYARTKWKEWLWFFFLSFVALKWIIPCHLFLQGILKSAPFTLNWVAFVNCEGEKE